MWCRIVVDEMLPFVNEMFREGVDEMQPILWNRHSFEGLAVFFMNQNYSFMGNITNMQFSLDDLQYVVKVDGLYKEPCVDEMQPNVD